MVKKIIFWVLTIIIFLVLTVGILIAALGYRVNWQRFTVSETSLVWLKGQEKDITVYLDNKKVGKKLPLRINFVNEGWREVQITKKGYYDWKKSFYAQNGQAYELRDIVLFKKDSQPKVVTNKSVIESMKYIVAPLNIAVSNGELSANDGLVSRFFKDPVAYQWYSDGQHILFQTDNDIRVIDIDGCNDNVLVTLENSQPSTFKVIDSGKVLVYTDGAVVKEAKIR